MKEDPNVEVTQQDRELAEALRNYVPGTVEEKKLVRKIDFFLMPILWLMYILNYIDRTNIVSAKPGEPRGEGTVSELTHRDRAMPRLRVCKPISS